MKNALKKSISILLVAVMVFGATPLAGFVGLDLPSIGNLFEIKAKAAKQDGYYYSVFYNGLAKITDVDTSISGDIVIPSTLGGYSVRSIDDFAFSYCRNLESVTIPDSVTGIGSDAFRGCTSLASVTIPDSVMSIGSSAFHDCYRLKSITIPDSVTSIGESVFNRCTSLESVTIGNSVTKIKNYTFNECTSLESVTIGNSVTSIGCGAFQECDSLESVIIPDSVTIICDTAFQECDSLASVTIGNGVTNIEDDVFSKCYNLKNVTIGNSVTSIGDFAFFGCSKLTSVTIPDSVTSIGDYAFTSCSSLATTYYTGTPLQWGKISIGSSNDYLTEKIICECNSENPYNGGICGENLIWKINEDGTELVIEGTGAMMDALDYSDVPRYKYASSIKSVTISNGVTTIGMFAFANDFNLESVIIPESVEHIKANAFYTSNIENVYYGGSKSEWEQITIAANNYSLSFAKIHYNSTGPINNGSTETPDNTPDYDSSVTDTYLVPTPTQTTISYGDSIVLHIGPSKIPEGGKVEWYPSNGNFSYSVSSDGTTCTISPEKSGTTTFTATIYDAEGNAVLKDEQTMTSKAGFFDKIIAFFKKLFGLTKTIPEAIKGIY